MVSLSQDMAKKLIIVHESIASNVQEVRHIAFILSDALYTLQRARFLLMYIRNKTQDADIVKAITEFLGDAI